MEIEVARSVAAQIETREHRQPAAKFLSVERTASGDDAKFALLDEAAGSSEALREVGLEVGAQGEAVGAKKRGRCELRVVADAPRVAGDEDRCVGAIELAIVDGVVGNGCVNRNQAGL